MMGFLNFRGNGGFTLMELLIAIAILGVLATGIIIAINPTLQIAKANDSKRKSDLRYITNLLNLYYNDKGKYPPVGTCAYGTNDYVYSWVGSSGACGTTGGSNWISQLVPKYAATLPVDPVNSAYAPWNTGSYTYAYGNVSPDGQHYDLFTQLQNQQDPDICGNKDYMYYYGFGVNSQHHWCTAFGGPYSNYIFELNHE